MGKAEGLGSVCLAQRRESVMASALLPHTLSLSPQRQMSRERNAPRSHSSSLRTRHCLPLAHDPSSSTAPSMCTLNPCVPLTIRASERLEQVCLAVIKGRKIFVSLAWLSCLLLVREAQVSGMRPRDADLPMAKMVRPPSAMGSRG